MSVLTGIGQALMSRPVMVTGTTKYYIAIGRRPRILKHLSVLSTSGKYSVSVTVLLHTE